MSRYLISYDISDSKLRTKFATILKNFGIRVQYSVFELDLDKRQFDILLTTIYQFTSQKENINIRIYSICQTCHDKVIVIGGSADILETFKNFMIFI